MHQALLRACVAALLLPYACAERKAPTASPSANDGGGSSPSSSKCPGGGPSVSLNVRGYAGGPELPPNALGTTLAWIGSFAQPCLDAPPEVPQFTLDITIPEPGQPPTFELVDRASVPALAACLDANFATAPPPPADPMIVRITIPWGCPTLGPATAEATAPTDAP